MVVGLQVLKLSVARRAGRPGSCLRGGRDGLVSASGWLGSLIAPIESTALTVIVYSVPGPALRASVPSALSPTGKPLRNGR